MERIDSIEKATRLARAIASDVAIYNLKKIEDGIKNDNLFDLIQKDLAEGEQLFRARVSSEIANNTNIFERAIIDILVEPKGHIKSPIW